MTSTVERLASSTGPFHGFIYFAPEASEEYNTIGLDASAHYFASRAAPMGPVGPELVVASFFNFYPGIVRAAIPAAWEMASPADIQEARMRAAGRVLRRVVGDITDVDEAIGIAQQIVDGVGDEGKALAAANRTVELPDDPIVRLWQLVTIIREWRGDAHVAALCVAPVTGVEALVLHAATGQVSAGALKMTRQWPEADWDAAVAALAERGLVNPDGSFTSEGEAFRSGIERQTNIAAQPLVDAVGDDAVNRLCEIIKPVSKALVSADDVFPAAMRRR